MPAHVGPGAQVRWSSRRRDDDIPAGPPGRPLLGQVALGLAQGGEGEGERDQKDGRSYAPEDQGHALGPLHHDAAKECPHRHAREGKYPRGTLHPPEQAVGHDGLAQSLGAYVEEYSEAHHQRPDAGGEPVRARGRHPRPVSLVRPIASPERLSPPRRAVLSRLQERRARIRPRGPRRREILARRGRRGSSRWCLPRSPCARSPYSLP